MIETCALSEQELLHDGRSVIGNDIPDVAWNVLVLDFDDSLFTHANSIAGNILIEGMPLALYAESTVDDAKDRFSELSDVAVVIMSITEHNRDGCLQFTQSIRRNPKSKWTRIVLGVPDSHVSSIPPDMADDIRSLEDFCSPRFLTILISNIKHHSISKQLYQAKREVEYQVRQRTEELLESKEAAEYNLRQRSDMLAHITHDLRSPLGGILGLSQMLAMGGSPEEQEEICNTISDSCEQLLDLVNNVLDFSKIESGEFTITTARFNLRECIDSVIQLMMPLAVQKGIALNLSFGFSVPDIINGDSTRMKQILQNLISNAIKFTDTGEVRLRVTVETDKVKTTLIMYVTDTGIGIPAEDQKQIFERYKQAENGQNGSSPGSGLGLFITKHLVTIMGGTMNLHSEVGKGTTFAIRLPLETLLEEDAAIETSGIQDGVSINLIDETTAETLRRKLISWGFTIKDNARRYTPNEPSEERTVAIFDQATFSRILNSRMAADLNRYLGIIWVKTAEIPETMLEVLTIPVKTLLLPLRTLAIAEACDTLFGSAHRKQLSKSEFSSIWPCLNLRILLVDENPADRQLMQIFLQKLKCKVKVFDKPEALDKLEHIEHYNAVIISAKLLTPCPALPGLPIIVCTDSSEHTCAQEDLPLMTEGILEKPVQPSKLIPLLDHFIARNQLGRTQTFSIH